MVELYFDLVFVFAVGQVAHGMVADPHWPSTAAALGLFATLWWTWIGFAVLDRLGDDPVAFLRGIQEEHHRDGEREPGS